MNAPTNTVRRSAKSIISAARHQSTQASSSTPKPKRIRASRSTLRSLVELHHKSAYFMPDASPATITQGLHNAVAVSNLQWQDYNAYDAAYDSMSGHKSQSWLKDVLERQRSRGVGGIEDFTVSKPGRVGAVIRPEDGPIQEPKRMKSAWRSEAPAAEEDFRSHREVLVLEALHGTYDRGAKGTKELGLEGVEDYVAARGKTVEEVADLWHMRNAE